MEHGTQLWFSWRNKTLAYCVAQLECGAEFIYSGKDHNWRFIWLFWVDVLSFRSGRVLDVSSCIFSTSAQHKEMVKVPSCFVFTHQKLRTGFIQFVNRWCWASGSLCKMYLTQWTPDSDITSWGNQRNSNSNTGTFCWNENSESREIANSFAVFAKGRNQLFLPRTCGKKNAAMKAPQKGNVCHPVCCFSTQLTSLHCQDNWGR